MTISSRNIPQLVVIGGISCKNICLTDLLKSPCATGEATKFSEALLFLHAAFKPNFFWWELLVVLRLFLLLGVAVCTGAKKAVLSRTKAGFLYATYAAAVTTFVVSITNPLKIERIQHNVF